MGRGEFDDLKGLSPSKASHPLDPFSGYTTVPTMDPPYSGTPKFPIEPSCFWWRRFEGDKTVILFFSTTNLAPTWWYCKTAKTRTKATNFLRKSMSVFLVNSIIIIIKTKIYILCMCSMCVCVCVFFGCCVFVRQNDFTCGEKKRERELLVLHCVVCFSLVWLFSLGGFLSFFI